MLVRTEIRGNSPHIAARGLGALLKNVFFINLQFTWFSYISELELQMDCICISFMHLKCLLAQNLYCLFKSQNMGIS
jgi:hypothetical protein